MRLLIVGPRWVGGTTEAVVRAVQNLGHSPIVFYYDRHRAPTVERLGLGVESYIPPTLRRLAGPLAKAIGRTWEATVNQRLLRAARRAQPDAILILKGEFLTERTIDELRALGRPLAAWWIDDPLRFPDFVPGLKHLDVLYMFDRGCFLELAAAGCRKLVYLPCAVDESVYNPDLATHRLRPDYFCRVAFAATYYPERGALLARMHGLDLGLWGMDWHNSPELLDFPARTWRGRRLQSSQAALVYHQADICPNMHHKQTRLGGLNMRTFEVPAAGGFELVDDVPGLDEHFDLGREIVSFSSPVHFRELADYYLAHPDERRAIAERGRARVLHNHTYVNRLRTILATLPT